MGKSARFDKIIGEMFLSDLELFVPVLLFLVNGHYPENWSYRIFISLPKKDLVNPINYRPIIIVSIYLIFLLIFQTHI